MADLNLCHRPSIPERNDSSALTEAQARVTFGQHRTTVGRSMRARNGGAITFLLRRWTAAAFDAVARPRRDPSLVLFPGAGASTACSALPTDGIVTRTNGHRSEW